MTGIVSGLKQASWPAFLFVVSSLTGIKTLNVTVGLAHAALDNLVHNLVQKALSHQFISFRMS